MAMSRLEGSSSDSDLRARVRFCASTGQVWLHEHRMLLVHAETQALWRKELVDMLGMARARGVLARMGYASGMQDAELARARADQGDEIEAYMTGPQLHSLEGIVNVTPIRIELDRESGEFFAEILWENSWEGQSHVRHYGLSTEPVCWTQIGYACGFSSAFMGQPILFREVECVGKGDASCRIVGRPPGGSADPPPFERQFLPESSVAEQLLDLQSEVTRLRSTIGEQVNLPAEIIGRSRALRSALELLRQAADSHITVLLLGETGVGKELFARALHGMSGRRQRPMIAVNCAAIPHDLIESELFGVEKGAYTGALVSRQGRFERADGGTLFLDEVGDLPLAAQSKLLRVLQEGEIERLGDDRTRKVDVRLVAATNMDLEQRVAEGEFRADLYYRLNALQVTIPPLRARKEDISPLANHFLHRFASVNGKKIRGFTDKAKRALLAYHWPGNIRELQNTLERGVILAPAGGRIEARHLFASCNDSEEDEFGLDAQGKLEVVPDQSSRDLLEMMCSNAMTLNQLEASLLEAAVDKAHGNLSSAARILGLTRPQLAYRLKRLHGKSDGGGDDSVAASGAT